MRVFRQANRIILGTNDKSFAKEPQSSSIREIILMAQDDDKDTPSFAKRLFENDFSVVLHGLNGTSARIDFDWDGSLPRDGAAFSCVVEKMRRRHTFSKLT